MRVPEPWHETFMSMAHTIAKRSLDPSTQCGSCIVGKGHRVLGLGYNGPPPQIYDDMVDWNDKPKKYPYIIHSEINAIYDAIDKCGSEAVKGSKLYVTSHPCPNCMLHIIRAGIRTVVWDDDPEKRPKMCDSASDALCREMIGKMKADCFLQMFKLSEVRDKSRANQ